MNSIIQINNLNKKFKDTSAIDDISFSVNRGESFGLVGPDGAGKTTIIRILCGLIQPDSGEVTILDKNLLKDILLIKNEIGYLSQKFSLYGDLTVDENIEFFAEIHNIRKYKDRRDELLAFTRLTEFRKRLAEKLSGGMKQKLALACTLIHHPKIIFLDEPTTGVDPVSRRDFWKILSSLQKEGITIFMSTPYLDEAERCNRIALINKGKIISCDTPENIKSSISSNIIELICSNVRNAYHLLKDNLEYEVQLFGDRINIVVDDYAKDKSIIESFLTSNSIEILDTRKTAPSLENVFIHLIEMNG